MPRINSRELDDLIAEEGATRQQPKTRCVHLYRNGQCRKGENCVCKSLRDDANAQLSPDTKFYAC